jgi:cytochrome c oxidase subunit 4
MTERAKHRIGPKTYVLVFGTLMILTAITIGAAFINLGPWNTVVMLAIAVTKATLVLLFFMHLAESDRLTKVTVVSGVFWLGILIALTLSDYITRGWLRITGT